MTLKQISIFNENFKNLLDIKQLGFEDLNTYYSFNLLKKSNDLQQKIHYSFYDSRDKSLKINGLAFSIVSPVVNTILEKISSNVMLNQMTKDDIISSIHEHTIYGIKTRENEDFSNLIYKINFVEEGIYYEDRLIEVVELFKRHIEIYMRPFFDSLTSLQEINDKIIDKYPENEWSNYFFGVTFFKVTIIMKLCNNPRYGTYSKMLKERIYDRAFNQGIVSAQDNYKIYSTLLEYLDSEEYKQVIV